MHWILNLHGVAAYAIIFAFPALEASIFLGFIFPGEIAVLLGGVLAYQGRVSLGGAIAAAVAGAIIGDSVGYEVGKRYGTRLLDGPLRRFIRIEHRDRALAFIQRHGGKSIFLGRFTAALRALVPGLAGLAGIPYRTFLLYNIAGGVVWAAGFTVGGFAAGSGYRQVEHVLGRASLVMLALVVFVLLVVVVARSISKHPTEIAAWWRRQRSRRVMRLFARPIDFVAARLRPSSVFGLQLTVGVVLVAVVGVAFGAVVQDVVSQQDLSLVDEPILATLMRHTGSGLTTLMKWVSPLGGTLFVSLAAGVVALLLALRRLWPRVAIMVAAPLGALILERTVKILVRRPPPPVHALTNATGFGFPSGHATVAVAFYGALALIAARASVRWPRAVAYWAGAFVIAGLIGFSRMYLRVHYFTDVLGGLALGTIWLAVVASGSGVWERARSTASARSNDASAENEAAEPAGRSPGSTAEPAGRSPGSTAEPAGRSPGSTAEH